jgi:hypothetical protein
MPFREWIWIARRALAVAAIVGVLVADSLGQEAGSKTSRQRSQAEKKAVSTESSLQPILNVLTKANLSGSLEFSGNCGSLAFPGYPEFPQVHAPSTMDGPALQTLRRLFADNPGIRVTQDPDGTIRMVERSVQIDILHLRIRHISFDRDAYDPNVAAEYIVSTPEIKLFMKSHDMQWPFGGGGAGSWIAGEIPPTAPHISSSMDNVTLSEAMDRVLKTFPGLWIYQNCPASNTRKRIIYFEFYELLDTPKVVITPIH